MENTTDIPWHIYPRLDYLTALAEDRKITLQSDDDSDYFCVEMDGYCLEGKRWRGYYVVGRINDTVIDDSPLLNEAVTRCFAQKRLIAALAADRLPARKTDTLVDTIAYTIPVCEKGPGGQSRIIGAQPCSRDAFLCSLRKWLRRLLAAIDRQAPKLIAAPEPDGYYWAGYEYDTWMHIRSAARQALPAVISACDRLPLVTVTAS